MRKKSLLLINNLKKRPFNIFSKSRFYKQNLYPSYQVEFEKFVPGFVEYLHSCRLCNPVVRRRVIVRARSYAYVSERSIEAFRKVVSPYFRKKRMKVSYSKFYIRCYSHLVLVKKPAEVRMGGGKGSKFRARVCPVKPGQTLFEVTFRPKLWAKRLLLHASKKLAIPVSISYI